MTLNLIVPPARLVLAAALPFLVGSPMRVTAPEEGGEFAADLECKIVAAISSNFNGTAIPAGRHIWFNSIVKVSGLGGQPATVNFIRSQLRFSAGGVNYVLDVPKSEITFDPAATQATTTWDSGAWHTRVPVSYSGNVFLDGLAFPVPVNLPGGINPVTWSGVFVTDDPNVTFQWKWAAAVYTSFSTDGQQLCVKPVDGSFPSPYPNSDHAGTPECFKSYVTGGARGGGGSNWTGSYSGTQTVDCP